MNNTPLLSATLSPTQTACQAREVTGKSMRGFALLLHTDPSVVSRWEAGLAIPSGPALVLLRLLVDQPERLRLAFGLDAEPVAIIPTEEPASAAPDSEEPEEKLKGIEEPWEVEDEPEDLWEDVPGHVKTGVAPSSWDPPKKNTKPKQTFAGDGEPPPVTERPEDFEPDPHWGNYE